MKHHLKFSINNQGIFIYNCQIINELQHYLIRKISPKVESQFLVGQCEIHLDLVTTCRWPQASTHQTIQHLKSAPTIRPMVPTLYVAEANVLTESVDASVLEHTREVMMALLPIAVYQLKTISYPRLMNSLAVKLVISKILQCFPLLEIFQTSLAFSKRLEKQV